MTRIEKKSNSEGESRVISPLSVISTLSEEALWALAEDSIHPMHKLEVAGVGGGGAGDGTDDPKKYVFLQRMTFWVQLRREFTVHPLNFLCLVPLSVGQHYNKERCQQHPTQGSWDAPAPSIMPPLFRSRPCSLWSTPTRPQDAAHGAPFSWMTPALQQHKSIFKDKLNAVCPRLLFARFSFHVNSSFRQTNYIRFSLSSLKCGT